ncbi:hypothetical protein PDR5_13210 [Pseudomonas sp. DR 5-09]|nr:hypothetical protein PDR5_13210 [Pseudomonas sp. DR 5-09]
MGGEGCHCFSLDRDSESLDTLCNSPVPQTLCAANLCGSGLAREGVGSANITVD